MFTKIHTKPGATVKNFKHIKTFLMRTFINTFFIQYWLTLYNIKSNRKILGWQYQS